VYDFVCFIGRKRKHTIVTCLECGKVKRFPADDQQLWSMQPDAWKIAPDGIVDSSCQLDTDVTDSNTGCDDARLAV